VWLDEEVVASQEGLCYLELLVAHSGTTMRTKILNILLTPMVMPHCLDFIISYFLHFLFTNSQCTLFKAIHFLTVTPTRFGAYLRNLQEVLDCFFCITSKWQKHLLILRSQFLQSPNFIITVQVSTPVCINIFKCLKC